MTNAWQGTGTAKQAPQAVTAPSGTAAPPAPEQITLPAIGSKMTQADREKLREDIRALVRDSKGGSPVINVPPDFVRNAVPQGAVDISIAFFFMIGAIIVGLPLARAFARRMDSRSQRIAQAPDIRPQIEALQQSVDAMALELERITEAQRFQSKLMAGKAEAAPARLP